MRIAVIGGALLLVGAVALATGILPFSEFVVLFDRVWPILLFVIAITITTELAAEAGVFDFIGQRLARWGRGRAIALWLMVVAFATVSTAFLSLDTTAVLLTPIVVILARHAGLNPLPFALTTVWLANAASLFLPVSNLTNLLADHALGGVGAAQFFALTWVPAIVATLVPVLAIALIYRRQLGERYIAPQVEPIDDRVLFGFSAAVIALLVPALVTPIPVALSASVAALLMLGLFAIRRPRDLHFALVPWQLVVFASGLFLVIEGAQSLGLAGFLARVAGTGESPQALLQLAGIGAAGANVANNLPAYLALEPVAESPHRLVALLIGVNAGPLITPWASLATLLWHERLTKLDVTISWWRYIALGVVVAPLTVVAATLAFALTR